MKIYLLMKLMKYFDEIEGEKCSKTDNRFQLKSTNGFFYHLRKNVFNSAKEKKKDG